MNGLYLCHFFLAVISSVMTATALSPSLLNRRSALLTTAGAATSLLVPQKQQPALAADDNLTSQLYNDDGSLRDDVQQEAKEKLLSFQWDVSDDGVIQMDGKLFSGTTSNAKVELEYKVPEKWISTPESLYVDPSEGANAQAASHIYVYQAPGTVTPKQLAKASTNGVGKTLSVLSPQLDQVRDADLVSGSRIDDSTYEFDLAWAPSTCSSKEDKNNLGLGFCAYENVYLLRATLLNDRLYVICIQATNQEWKQANAELKRLRHSFQVTSL